MFGKETTGPTAAEDKGADFAERGLGGGKRAQKKRHGMKRKKMGRKKSKGRY